MLRKTPTVAALTLLLLPAIGAPKNDNIEWISGHWCMNSGNQSIEEVWLTPLKGVTVGLSRTVEAGQTVGFEYMRIVNVEGIATFIAQPGGRQPTAFSRTDGGNNWVRFENPDHDFPQRIEYRRESNSLVAEVAGTTADNRERIIPFHYTRCD